MKVVRIENNRVAEVIPEYALPVAKWYGEEFAKSCVDAPDEVDQRWVYDPVTSTFSAPSNEPKPAPADLTQEQIKAISDRQDFLEDCIAEMATQVYS